MRQAPSLGGTITTGGVSLAPVPPRLRVNLLRVALALALAAPATTAHAETPACEQRCSVNRNCSNTGIACAPDDRECTNGATAKGLEVKCEQTCESGKRFIYCPADAGRSDSGFVWVLLALAGGLAVGGTALAYSVLRKRA